MKKRSRDMEIFGLSFLDVISCGFGVIVMLVLLSKTSDIGGTEDVARIADLLSKLGQAEVSGVSLQAKSEQLSSELTESLARERQVQNLIEKNQQMLAKLRSEAGDLKGQTAHLRAALAPAFAASAAISADDTDEPDPAVGGIPVGAHYVVFILDTSGSMKEIWGRVINTLENVLDIHPKVKGFQVLNDNGHHLISGYRGKWISDTTSSRSRALDLMRSWNAISDSSPVEGLEVALRKYVKPGKKTAVYIFGDDYTGSSYDLVINTIYKLNIDRRTREPMASIHGIGFYNAAGGGHPDRFGILMREVSRHSRGTFIALK